VGRVTFMQQILFENKQKFLLCHSTSAHKHALTEILEDEKFAGAVVDTKVCVAHVHP